VQDDDPDACDATVTMVVGSRELPLATSFEKVSTSISEELQCEFCLLTMVSSSSIARIMLLQEAVALIEGEDAVARGCCTDRGLLSATSFEGKVSANCSARKNYNGNSVYSLP
jgi:hypothetical protein